MNIHAKCGDKVVFSHPDFGTNYDKKNAREHLTLNQVYTVDGTMVHSFETDIYLVEIPDIWFNSVQFDDF